MFLSRQPLCALGAIAPSFLLLLLGTGSVRAADSDADQNAIPQASEEPQQIDDRQVRVRASKEVTIDATAPDEEDVLYRELWFSSFDGKEWSPWAKHGITFPKHTVITWAPGEGYWKIYIRKVHVAGDSNPVPVADSANMGEFIIDRTPPTAAITYPASKTKLRGGQKYTITWDASDPHLKAAPVTLRYSRDGKGEWTTIVENAPNSGSYDWIVPKDMTTTGQLQILVADKAGNVGVAGVDSLLVDSINPHGRVLGPAISAKNEVTLALDVADVGPAGMDSARLWVSQDDGTSWNEGPFIQAPFKSVTWKTPSDGNFRLAVVATDQAGNVSALPRGKDDGQFQLVVDTTPPVVRLAFPIGVVEAEKTSSAKKAFTPGTRVAVPFSVSDANLQPNSAVVSIQYAPDEPWIVMGKDLPTDAAFRFDLPTPKATTKVARVKVAAVDLAGNQGEAVSSEPFTIDTGVAIDTIHIK